MALTPAPAPGFPSSPPPPCESSRIQSCRQPAENLDITANGALNSDLTVLWILFSAYLVFFMQCGFGMLEAGSVRFKNTKNILLKNVIDTCVGTLCWWATGYAFQMGQCGESAFIGYSHFFLTEPSELTPSQYAKWVFGWAFSASAVTIVSGAIAERAQLRAYVLYAIGMTGFCYPVVAHWVWSNQGWLSATKIDCQGGYATRTFADTMGLIDFAGSAVVHITGGGAALIGAIILGPRTGRFTADGHVVDMPGCNPAFQALGTFILWMGWYGFTTGSTQCFYNCMHVSARVAVNTTLAASTGGATSLLLLVLLGDAGDVATVLNGILSALVAINAGCAVVQAYSAVLIAVISGIVYAMGAKLLVFLRIDDPLNAVSVHFFNGCWGTIAVGFFATESYVSSTYNQPATDWGVLYGGSGKQLGVQLLGMVTIAAWTLAWNGTLFYTLKLLGWLRVEASQEIEGLDIATGLRTGLLRCWQV